jgi:hypothetical protein
MESSKMRTPEMGSMYLLLSRLLPVSGNESIILMMLRA